MHTLAPVADIGTATAGADVEFVRGGAGQVTDSERIGVRRDRGGRGAVRIKARCTVGNLPRSGGTDLRPTQLKAVDGGVRYMHVLRLRTSRDQIDGEFIDVTVAVRTGVGILKRNIVATARISAEDNFFFHPCGSRGGRRINRVNRHEGAGIGGIGHHTHNHVVRRAGCSVHERGLQRVHRNGSIELRDNGDVVCTAGTRIEVERTHTGIVRGVDVRSVSRIGVDLTPAERISGITRTVGVEALRVGQLGDGVALGGSGKLRGVVAVVAATTVGLDVEVIRGGGGQSADSVRVGAGVLNGAGTAAGRKAGGTVLNHPGGGGTVLRPTQLDGAGGSTHHMHLSRLRTCRNQVNDQVVHVSVCGSGRVGILERNVLTSALVLVEDHLALHPSGVAGGGTNRVNRHEGAGIGRIGHHTHNQTVGSVRGLVHERGLQRVDRNGLVKRRGDGDVVGAAGTCIEVEGSHTGKVRGVDVRSVGRIGVDLAPAVRVSRLAGAVGVEAFHVRQRRDSIACGRNRVNVGQGAEIAAAAV